MKRRIERPYWFLDDDLAYLFGYPTIQAARSSISRGKFPIPTFKIRSMHCADRRVVTRYFQEIRREQLAEFESWKQAGKYHKA